MSTNFGLLYIILISSFLFMVFLILEYCEASSIFSGLVFIIFISLFSLDIIVSHFFGSCFIFLEMIFNLDFVILFSKVLY